jgi:hypothetical protein
MQQSFAEGLGTESLLKTGVEAWSTSQKTIINPKTTEPQNVDLGQSRNSIPI